MKTVFGYIRPHAPMMGIVMAVKLLGTVAELFLPWMLSYIIDELVPLGSLEKIYLWGGLMTLCAVAAWLANIFANRSSTKISREITRSLRHDLFDKTLYLSCRKTDEYTVPSLISRLTSDTYNIHQMVDRMQRLGVRAPILLIGGIIVTLSLDTALALVLICALPLLGCAVWYITRKGIPMYTRSQRSLDGLVGRIQDYMSGVRVIRALSKTDYECERFEKANSEVIHNEQKASALMALTNPLMTVILNGGLVAVILLGAYRVNLGIMGTGKIIAFLSYFTIILNAILMVSRLFVLYSKGAASAKRVETILCEPQPPAPLPSNKEQGDCHIEFRNVSFSYNGRLPDLDNISFRLKKGESLGIIGATGSGKSTLLKLLLHFYDADSGDILIDGESIRSLPDKILRASIGVVFQNDFLFDDTIESNIDFFRSVNEDDINKSLKIAQGDFVFAREDSINGKIASRGADVSGGQAQRLLIARAIAAKPSILLLDDCSSALDYKTDAALRRALSTELSNTTTVTVAQRISSVMSCDLIIMLDEGKILGKGTHGELMQSCAQYREIYDAQMGGALYG